MRTALLDWVAGLCAIGLCLLGLGIYLFTLYLAYLTSFPSLLMTLFFPFLAQLYWIWALWSATGVFFNLLTALCLGWIVLAVVTFGLVSRASK
jgi:hypothetical protein